MTIFDENDVREADRSGHVAHRIRRVLDEDLPGPPSPASTACIHCGAADLEHEADRAAVACELRGTAGVGRAVRPVH